MAIDTAIKRASAISPGSPWRAVLPLPDGAIAQGDRQTVAFWYAGILAAGAASETGTPAPTFHARPQSITFHARPQSTTFHARPR